MQALTRRPTVLHSLKTTSLNFSDNLNIRTYFRLEIAENTERAQVRHDHDKFVLVFLWFAFQSHPIAGDTICKRLVARSKDGIPAAYTTSTGVTLAVRWGPGSVHSRKEELVIFWFILDLQDSACLKVSSTHQNSSSTPSAYLKVGMYHVPARCPSFQCQEDNLLPKTPTPCPTLTCYIVSNTGTSFILACAIVFSTLGIRSATESCSIWLFEIDLDVSFAFGRVFASRTNFLPKKLVFPRSRYVFASGETVILWT
ncbi:hypothetical protein C8Q75DRAFT_737928 [Abortiporus biennis]|nr:hypothetical protein C8Q75DRAFT_737928 [Abortiporus biennis]